MKKKGIFAMVIMLAVVLIATLIVLNVKNNDKDLLSTYLVGEDVTLIDGTTWVVVKDSISSESDIKLMATSNVYKNLTTEIGTNIFVKEELPYKESYRDYAMAYDDSANYSNVWETSTLKSYLDSTVKSRLEASLNTTISEITIWGVEELNALGCSVVGSETEGYSSVSCDNTTDWYSKVFENTISWTKLPYAENENSHCVWNVDYTGYFSFGNVRFGGVIVHGIRPVITVSKSVISQ